VLSLVTTIASFLRGAEIARSTILRALDRIRGATTIVGAIAGIGTALASLVSVFAGGQSRPTWIAFAVAAIAVGITALIGIISAAQRRASKRVDLKLSDVELRLENANEADVDSIVRFWANSVPSEPDPELLRQRAQRYLVDESGLRHEVESWVLAFMPRQPRSVKRLLNHLRLQLALAVARGVLGGSPPLEYSHIAKWVVLTYRWPTVAEMITANPSSAAELERSSDVSALEGTLITAGVEISSFNDLFQLLRAEPPIAAIADRLGGGQTQAQATV
jgi:hypothetical protein